MAPKERAQSPTRSLPRTGGGGTCQLSRSYKLTSWVEEDHRKPIFCIAFNQLDPAHANIFASVGANRACVYSCHPDGDIQLLQSYSDEDPEENFYVCKWGADPESGAPLLLLAGQNGVVRVVDCSRNTLLHSFTGHGSSINDIAVLPQQPTLFLTASKDESLRLWNLRSRTCVLIMSGDGGHKNEVLSLDFHPWDGHRFLSSGMDNCVKVWSLAEHSSVVEQSHTWKDKTRAFPTTYMHRPIFSSTQVHGNYVDCVRWLGGLVLSKSVDFEILLWKPEPSQEPGVHVSGTFQLLQRFPLPDSKMWFVRFSMDCSFSLMACGNKSGRVYLYNPHEAPPPQPHPLKTRNSSVVRQTAVSRDGSVLLASCEDGVIYRFDKGRADGTGTGTAASGATSRGTTTADASGGRAGESSDEGGDEEEEEEEEDAVEDDSDDDEFTA